MAKSVQLQLERQTGPSYNFENHERFYIKVVVYLSYFLIGMKNASKNFCYIGSHGNR